jgi:hypothetical protein
LRIHRPAYSRDSGPVLRAKIRDAVAKSQQDKNARSVETRPEPKLETPGRRDTFEPTNERTRKKDNTGLQEVFIPGPYWKEIALGRALLLRGHQGNAVKQLQNFLRDHGEPTIVDGQFGALTEQAVRGFQAKNRLLVTGRLDRATLTRLSGD